MWAGGGIKFDDTIRLRAGEMRCQESIVDVDIKGNEGAERVFVTIQRYISSRKQDGSIVENRTLVFMRDQPRAADDVVIPRKGKRRTAHFCHTLTPSPALLFRFSALTFNAHRIHLDQGYCRDVEGYRNLLVHGPLSLVLMLQFLQILLTNEGQEREGKSDTITHVAYRCVAPLYAEEQLKVCIKRLSSHKWQTWIEGPDGGLAVLGAVRTAPPLRPGVRREVQSAASSIGEREEQSLGTSGVSLHHIPKVDRPTSSTHGAVSPEAANSATKTVSVEEISSTEEGELSVGDAEVART
ncbi:MAG: hypothetical protein Q9207_000957 [Kuettlingeria erythrocarpa]